MKRWLSLPRAIELMRRREEELSKAVLYLSEKTNGFTEPRIVLIGGYARATLPDQTVGQPRGFIFLVGCAVHRIFSADSASSCRARRWMFARSADVSCA